MTTKTVTLVGLPGVEQEKTGAVCVRSRTAAIRALQAGAAAITAAGDNGALNVWRNDAGAWCCEFQRRMVTLNGGEWKHLAAVDAWLAYWFPRLRQEA